MKKVSVIIPVHNSAKYIEDCIESVLYQSYKNLEVIVVDDKSTDETISIIKSKNDARVRIIELEENLGVAIARNKGVEAATGDYLCFIDSDDYWYSDKIKKQVEFMEANNYQFIYSSYEYLKGDKTHVARVPKYMNYNKALKNTAIFTSTVMFDMNYFKKEDIFMPNVRKGQDTATWWKILKTGVTAYGMQEVLSIYRIGNDSLSSNKIGALKRTWDSYVREDISYPKKIYCFVFYVINAIIRRIF